MPEQEVKKPEIAGAICAPPVEQPRNVEPTLQQPRQPTNLQGLLKFAMDATRMETAPNDSRLLPLDDDRKRFLENAFRSLTINVIEMLTNQIKLLENVDNLEESDDASEYITALETISDHVCNIDTANDFQKIGGFMILQPSLKCVKPEVRAQVCNLLAELCQNNPYCQDIIVENTFINDLLNIVKNDANNEVVVKALYAISCIIRDNTRGFNQFIQYCGVQIFLKTLKRENEKFVIKICFLLSALCNNQPDFRSRLIFEGYVPVLINLITVERKSSHEQVLALLLNLIENNSTAVAECKQNDAFRDVLNDYLNSIRNLEECLEEVEYAECISNILYPRS